VVTPGGSQRLEKMAKTDRYGHSREANARKGLKFQAKVAIAKNEGVGSVEKCENLRGNAIYYGQDPLKRSENDPKLSQMIANRTNPFVNRRKPTPK